MNEYVILHYGVCPIINSLESKCGNRVKKTVNNWGNFRTVYRKHIIFSDIYNVISMIFTILMIIMKTILRYSCLLVPFYVNFIILIVLHKQNFFTYHVIEI